MIHNRQSIRLKNYNYKKKGMYFITICIKDREPLLGKIIQGEMFLSNSGKIVEKNISNIHLKFSHSNIDIFQIMPNHIHFILDVDNNSPFTVGDIIRYFKGRTSSKSNISWQRNYYEHIIRNEKEYSQIYNYIKNNPLNWDKDVNCI